jgi:hypothetical protein
MPVAKKEIKWGEDNPIENVPVLTEEERDILDKKMAAMDALFAELGKAKYKIEILFGSGLSMNKPSVGAVSFWESGSKFHGGGDAKLYMCPGAKLGKSDCTQLIPDSANGYGHLVCPKCGSVWKGDDVIGEVFARMSMQHWSELILYYFNKMSHNADIRIKYPPDDIRSIAMQEQYKDLGGERLGDARRKRAVAIYPLRNIITDTSNGADLLGRFYAFLTA